MNKQALATLSTEEIKFLLQERQEQERKHRQDERNAYEQLKEETVVLLFDEAVNQNSSLSTFKINSFEKMNALHLLLRDYSKRYQDGKGNFTIESKDGTKRIVHKCHDYGHFDERSKTAEAHILEFLNRKFESDKSTRQLILSLLERRKGSLDIQLVQRLYSMEESFEDENWREGIKLLKESWQPTESKYYIAFYQRCTNNEWKLINLNFSSI